MRLKDRPRYFVRPGWLQLARVLFRYSLLHDVYIPRLVGAEHGPILLADRRERTDRRRRQVPIRQRDRRFMGWDRRTASGLA